MAVAEDGEGDCFADGVFAEESAEGSRSADFDVVDGEDDVAFFKAGGLGGGAFNDVGDVGAES